MRGGISARMKRRPACGGADSGSWPGAGDGWTPSGRRTRRRRLIQRGIFAAMMAGAAPLLAFWYWKFQGVHEFSGGCIGVTGPAVEIAEEEYGAMRQRANMGK